MSFNQSLPHVYDFGWEDGKNPNEKANIEKEHKAGLRLIKRGLKKKQDKINRQTQITNKKKTST